MKHLLISIIFSLSVFSCCNVEINCKAHGQKNIKTSHGNICVSEEFELIDIELLIKKIKIPTNELILSIEADRNNGAKIITSKEKKLSFGHGNLYLFEKTKGQWVSVGNGTWVAD